MKKLLPFLVPFCVFSVATAQSVNTQVSATITDPNGCIYQNGSFNINLVSSTGQDISTAPVYISSIPFNDIPVAGNMDAFGHFSVSVLANDSFTAPASPDPNGSQYNFSVCSQNPAGNPGSQIPPQRCFSGIFTVTGDTLDLTSQLSALAAPLGCSAGSGTVKSVGLSLPSIFNVSGSPVTGTGVLTGTLANENANTVFAGPSSGSAAPPTFRALTVADIPSGLPYLPSSTSLFYQTVDANGTAQTQRSALNFSSNFTLSDSSSPSRTAVDLANTGTPATTTCPASFTTDAKGRVTAATSGDCPGSSTQTDETAFRSWGTSYQNTTGSTLIVSGFTTTPGGSSTGTITCMSGASSPSLEVWGNEYTATVDSAPVAFFCIVPNNFYYSLSVSGDIAGSPSKWIETTVN